MKKFILVLLGLLIALVLVNMAYADATPVIVAGTVYYPTIGAGNELADANVNVVCDGETKDTVSDPDGDYSVDFTGTDCGVGDTAIVTASKDGFGSGSESDTVTDYTFVKLAVVNLAIPEFGAITAGLALAGSGVGYAFIRRKMLSRKIRKIK